MVLLAIVLSAIVVIDLLVGRRADVASTIRF
jgi:hypothetical protein